MKEGITRALRSVLTAILIVALFTLTCLAVSEISGGSDLESACDLQLNKEYKCLIPDDFNQSCSYFRFKTTSRGGVNYKLNVRNTGEAGFDIYILDATGEEIWRHVGFQKDKPMDFEFALSKNKTYYLRIENVTAQQGSCLLKISTPLAPPARPVIKSCKAGKNKLTVRWETVPYATKYKIQYKREDSSKWVTRTVKDTKYTIRKLKSGKKYMVRVKAVRIVKNKTLTSKWSKSAIRRIK